MNYETYLNKIVKITLTNKYYFSGKIKQVDKDNILLIDKFGKDVIIKKEMIAHMIEQ